MASSARQRYLLWYIIVPGIAACGLLIAAFAGYQNQATGDNGLSEHGVTTSAVIDTLSRGPHDPQTYGPSFDLHANVTFLVHGRPVAQTIFLETCRGPCVTTYRLGERITITYDSQGPAHAILGRPSFTLGHLNVATVILTIFGLVFLAATVINLCNWRLGVSALTRRRRKARP